MTNEIIEVSQNAINWNDSKVVQTIKNTVARGATTDEFQMFSQFCQSTGLNPFKKEIWFIKTGSGVQMMTGVNGFMSIANSHPQFDGMEVETIEDEKGRPLKSICKVYRKDRRIPSTGTARWSEYGKTKGIWAEKPCHMLEKVAKTIAIREAFPQELNGLYTQEEMPPEFAAPKAEVVEQPVKKQAQNFPLPSTPAKLTREANGNGGKNEAIEELKGLKFSHGSDKWTAQYIFDCYDKDLLVMYVRKLAAELGEGELEACCKRLEELGFSKRQVEKICAGE